MLQARREELQKEVLDLLSHQQQPSDSALKAASSKLLQPSTPAAGPPSPGNGKLLLQTSSSLDGSHSYKDDQEAVIVPVLPSNSASPEGVASSGSITRAWLADVAHAPHEHTSGLKGILMHFRQAARVSAGCFPRSLRHCS